MSISREVIAEVIHVPAERVKCENCVCAIKLVNCTYICKGWSERLTYADRYCSLFTEREEGDRT